MAITPSDFSKIWASNADTPEYTFSDADYLKGWDFVGNLPPTRAMWNAMQKSTDEKMKYVFNNFGAPLTASTVAGMTMQNRVYVYTGNETGYTAGHWYYYDAGTSAWVDGGVYNAVAVVTDTTLTQVGVPADAKATGDRITEIDDVIFTESVNNYNPALQTQSTISPHYYMNGVPYSTTQFDNQYNCTAMIKVESSTTYTIGIIPDIGGYSVPWRTSVQGLFCYDENGDYIASSNTTTNTFTTPANCKYIRFNYFIGTNWGLTEINRRCVLVKGSTLPASYIPYTGGNLKDKIEMLRKNTESWYRVSADTLEVGYNYSSTENIVVVFNKHGGNNLFDFANIYAVPNNIDYENYVGNTRTILTNGSDMFSPYVVKAVNNADGTDPVGNANHFTGGNHQYNNTGSGSTATARTDTLQFFADNRQVSSGSGYAQKIEARWTNYVQGNNTEKIDGTGREILKCIHSAIFENGKIKVSTTIEPLEDVVMSTFYGFVCFFGSTTFTNVRFVGGSNRLAYTVASNSGDKNCYEVDGYNLTDMYKLKINPLVDLGRFQFIGNSSYTAFSAGVKVYYNVIRASTTMNTGEHYVLEGEYEFIAIQ